MKKLVLTILILIILVPLLEGQNGLEVRKHSGISTRLNEAAAVPYEDGVVYITEQTSVGASSYSTPQGRKLYTIFYFGKSGQKKPFREELVSNKHEGPVSFTEDFNTMVFSQQRPSAGSRLDPLGLYFAERDVTGQWVNERAFEFNTPEAWLFSPSISPDGNTLFFSANYEDSFGGFDLYVSRFRNGNWTPPENLGPTVNTDKHELYPFIHASGKLFFSSDGHDNSVDGYDVFESSFENGQWNDVQKISSPINSKADDFHVYFNKDFTGGYLTSDRGSSSRDIFIIEVKEP